MWLPYELTQAGQPSKGSPVCFCMHWHCWGLKSSDCVSSWPHLPQLPPSFGAEGQELWCRRGEGALAPISTVWALPWLCCWAVPAPGSCCQQWQSLDEVACWEFPRVSRDGLNFRAPGWCCLKWLGTALHLSASVPLKWNPTFSRNVALPYPGPTNTSVEQLLFKREFWCKQQVPVTRYSVLLALMVLHFVCERVSLSLGYI